MLELAHAEATVVRLMARAAALDSLPGLEDVFRGRVAADELMLIALAPGRQDLVEAAAAHFDAVDPDALVIGETDGWTIWTISGGAADEAFARLSALPLPATRPAFLQGAVAGVPAKVVAEPGRLHIVLVASLGDHVRERVLSACADLEPTEVGS